MSDPYIPKALRAKVAAQARHRCGFCNDHKGDRIAALDPLTDEIVRLFDPRHQVWQEHFEWTAEGDRINGLTPIGRATIVALSLNRPSLVKARQAWVAVGWHPPKG